MSSLLMNKKIAINLTLTGAGNTPSIHMAPLRLQMIEYPYTFFLFLATVAATEACTAVLMPPRAAQSCEASDPSPTHLKWLSSMVVNRSPSFDAWNSPVSCQYTSIKHVRMYDWWKHELKVRKHGNTTGESMMKYTYECTCSMHLNAWTTRLNISYRA